MPYSWDAAIKESTSCLSFLHVPTSFSQPEELPRDLVKLWTQTSTLKTNSFAKRVQFSIHEVASRKGSSQQTTVKYQSKEVYGSFLWPRVAFGQVLLRIMLS